MTDKYLLALCPSQGPERFVPDTAISYPTFDEAHATGAALLMADKPSYRAFQVWTMGETYRLEPRVVKAAA